MQRSRQRFLTTHQGSLARPPDLLALLLARQEGQPYDAAKLGTRLRAAVADVVQQQVDAGIDVVNDGELSKVGWAAYFASRLSGVEQRPGRASVPQHGITARDLRVFPEWFELARSAGGPVYSWVALAAARQGQSTGGSFRMGNFCAGPLTYTGQAEVETDIANLKAACQGKPVANMFLTALGPATMAFFMANDYYPSDEEYAHALADAMHHEYKAITDAGVVLQVDEPALAANWQTYPDMTVAEYRRWVQAQVEVLNHALRGVPPELVRVHVCWGSLHHPHEHDIPLAEILDLILQLNVQTYSFEAANPRHDADWQVWDKAKLPDGKILMPGVVGHYTDFVEAPELVAERFAKYARVVGRENIIGGTDCGVATRVGHPSIGWAKFRAMSEGARLASNQLF